MKHYTIPIFVPHLGCPCQCSFCNQKTITGISPMTPAMAKQQIDDHLNTLPRDAHIEIAFFGGSFTAIPRNQMEALLQIASPYLASEQVSSIRISTRPDAIDRDVLDLLAHYGVQTIELGIQSISDHVLTACNRGHSANDTYRATKLIIDHGMRLGGQMMVGLPGSTLADELATARAIIEMGACEARIYPVVVFANTPLATQTARGEYTPLTEREAVKRTASSLELLLNANIRLLRIGLCETESLHQSGQLIGGAYHPALGELCYSEIYLNRIMKLLSVMNTFLQSSIKIAVAPGRLSMAIGQKRCNVKAIKEKYPNLSLYFAEDPTLIGYCVRVDLIQELKGSN